MAEGSRHSSLAAAVHAMPGPVFAVLDGGQFDDLPALLRKADVKARSLFLGQSKFETQKFGPWLADTYSEASINRLLAVTADKPAAVFWSFPPGEAALYKHLRKTNEAIVPRPTEDAPVRGYGEPHAPSDYEITPALFRHWDPRVLIEVLPVLDESQFDRVLGEAELLVMRDEDGTVVEAPAHRAQPVTDYRPLQLSIEQIENISRRRVERSHRRIANYLREATPDRCAGLDDGKLIAFVERSERSAAALGVKGEHAHGIWAYMQITSMGDFSHDPRIQNLFRIADSSTPDQRVLMLFDARLNAMKMAR